MVWIAHLVVLMHALCLETMSVTGSDDAAISALSWLMRRVISGGRSVDGVGVGAGAGAGTDGGTGWDDGAGD
jgi:hypothetical protein